MRTGRQGITLKYFNQVIALRIEFEKMSRRILAPAQAGPVRESKWFYERARGQYHDAAE